MARIDTATGEVGDVVDLGQTVVQPQVLGDSLWVHESDGLTEYDATTGDELDRVDIVTHRVHDFFVTEDAIWFLADVDNFEQTGLVVRLDPETGREGQVRILESRPSHLTVADGQVFVSGSTGMLFEVSTDDDQALEILAAEQVTVSTKDLRGLIVQDDIVWVADGTNGVVHQSIDGLEGDDPVTDGSEPSIG